MTETQVKLQRAKIPGTLFEAVGDADGCTNYNGRKYVRAALKVPKAGVELWHFDMVYLHDMPKGPYMSMGLDFLFDVNLSKHLFTNKDNGGQKFRFYKFWDGEKFFYVKPSNLWMFNEIDRSTR